MTKKKFLFYSLPLLMVFGLLFLKFGPKYEQQLNGKEKVTQTKTLFSFKNEYAQTMQEVFENYGLDYRKSKSDQGKIYFDFSNKNEIKTAILIAEDIETVSKGLTVEIVKFSNEGEIIRETKKIKPTKENNAFPKDLIYSGIKCHIRPDIKSCRIDVISNKMEIQKDRIKEALLSSVDFQADEITLNMITPEEYSNSKKYISYSKFKNRNPELP